MNSIGERIRHLRKVNKLTQKEFASLINLSQGRLSELEQNKTKPSSDTLISICKNFKISINWLLIGEEISLDNIKTDDALLEYLELNKELKKKGFTPKDIRELITTIEKITRKDKNY